MSNRNIYQPKSITHLIRTEGKRLSFEKNDYIYLPADEETSIFVIDSGEVFIGKMQEEGKELIYKLLSKNNIFGATRVFNDNIVYGSYAKAKIATHVYALDRDAFIEHYTSNEDIKYQWAKYLEIESERYSTKMRDMFMHGKIGALASILIRLSNSYGVRDESDIKINTILTNQDLASMCGSTREGVNRLLSELKEKGIISVEHKRIIIHDIGALRQIVHCDMCSVEYCQVF